jgi:hypothetical protein
MALREMNETLLGEQPYDLIELFTDYADLLDVVADVERPAVWSNPDLELVNVDANNPALLNFIGVMYYGYPSLVTKAQREYMTETLIRAYVTCELDDDARRELDETRQWLSDNDGGRYNYG